MALETVTNIDDLVITNPLSTDARSQGDDHIRNIKLALKTDLPNITGVMTATQAELNVNTGVTGGTVTASKTVVVDASSKVDVWNVDNLVLNGNTISAGTGAINITPAAGSAIVLDGTINVDAGVVTGATSVTSTTFVGALTGNADTATSATSATTAGTVTTATQASITTAANLVTVGALDSGSITSNFGAIDNGASAITTTGTITGGVVVADNININGNTIISTDAAGAINITPNTTGDLVLDGVKWPQADGSANQILITDGAAQTSWATPATTTALTTQGDILFQNATTLARLAAGTSGFYLKTQGAGADPVWAAVVGTDVTTKGDLQGYAAAGARIPVGTDGQVLVSDSSDTNGVSWTSNVGTRNDIINGGLVVNQENQTAPADAAYTIGDLFLHNGEGTPVMSLQTSGGPQGTRPWQKMVLDANAQGGLVYFVPNDTVQDYIANGKMSFGVQLRTVTGALVDNARIGIIKWAGTADAPTKEIVGTWASDGTNPTLATSLTYENTPADLALTNAWQRFTVEDITVDSDTTNIVIFIWTDDGTITASDAIGFAEWQLNPGSTVNDFSSPPKSEVSDQVDFYLQRYDYNTITTEQIAGGGVTTTTAVMICQFPYRRKLRSGPVVTLSAAGTFNGGEGGVNAAGTIVGTSFVGVHDMQIDLTQGGTTWTAGRGVYLRRNGTDTTWIMLDSRIGV